MRTMPRRRISLRGLALWLICAALAGFPAVARATPATTVSEKPAAESQAADFRQFLESMWPEAQEAGVSRTTFDAAIDGLTPDPAIMARTTRQAEFTISIATYVATTVTGKRVAQGRDVAAALSAPLAKLQTRYGVPWEILVAILGVESNYGTSADGSDILRVLATLAFKQHRGSLFRDEFVAALVMIEKGYATRAKLVGSWAGAMGQPQFMPSSYLKYAAAYDGSSAPDIWTSRTDALASIGNFLQKSGWVAGLPACVEVVIPATFDFASLSDPFPNWQALGFRAASGKPLPAFGNARLFMPAGAKGPAWLISDNFFVIKQYNTSDAYALSVALLSQRIADEGDIRTPWPKDFKALSIADGRVVQQALTKLGLYQGSTDGKLGPATRDAVHAYQIKAGLQPADGFVTQALVQKVRSEAGL